MTSWWHPRWGCYMVCYDETVVFCWWHCQQNRAYKKHREIFRVTMQTTLSFLRRHVKKDWNTSDFNLDVKCNLQLVLWGNSEADIYGKDDWGLPRWHFHLVFCIVWAGLVSLSESTTWRQIWQTWDQTADKNSLFPSDPSQPLMPQITHIVCPRYSHCLFCCKRVSRKLHWQNTWLLRTSNNEMPAWRKCLVLTHARPRNRLVWVAGMLVCFMFKYHATENYVKIIFLLVVIAPIPPLK